MSNIRRIEQAFKRKSEIPSFQIGDTVDVHVQIREGDKERVQVYSGTVIRHRGGGLGASFTVRRIVQGEGVERTFPLHSPFVQKVEVKRSGKVRRSRLYYLRDRTGKATRLREIIEGVEEGSAPAARPAAPAPAPKEPAPAEAPSKA